MSIATVITGGFGSFGSVNLVITDGYAIGAAVVDTVIGRRRRTRRYRRWLPDPEITAPESVDAYAAPLPVPEAYVPYATPFEAIETALDSLERAVAIAELRRDVAMYRDARRRQRDMERIVAKKRRDAEDDEAAVWLLLN